MQVFDVTKVYGVYEKQPVGGKQVHRAPAAPKQDKLSLSGDAKDFQAVMRGLKDAPDIRADKVADLAGKYESGAYRAEPKDIAESLANSGLFSRR
ncbi:MAG: flagellar biosynthesis anti-sigma factor FlgM [Clostridiales bacterium]|jgi:negative regulator of flagellin synthesis FlgM|nr:flagellar biosynthesis anti-sigma factor FlgM [Clostridiales bacterium]